LSKRSCPRVRRGETMVTHLVDSPLTENKRPRAIGTSNPRRRCVIPQVGRGLRTRPLDVLPDKPTGSLITEFARSQDGPATPIFSLVCPSSPFPTEPVTMLPTHKAAKTDIKPVKITVRSQKMGVPSCANGGMY